VTNYRTLLLSAVQWPCSVRMEFFQLEPDEKAFLAGVRATRKTANEVASALHVYLKRRPLHAATVERSQGLSPFFSHRNARDASAPSRERRGQACCRRARHFEPPLEEAIRAMKSSRRKVEHILLLTLVKRFSTASSPRGFSGTWEKPQTTKRFFDGSPLPRAR